MTKNSGFAIFSRATDFLFKKRHVNVDGVSETSFTEYWEKGNNGSFLTEHVICWSTFNSFCFCLEKKAR